MSKRKNAQRLGEEHLDKKGKRRGGGKTMNEHWQFKEKQMVRSYQVNSTDAEGNEHAERWTNDWGLAFSAAKTALAKDDVVKVSIEKQRILVLP